MCRGGCECDEELYLPVCEQTLASSLVPSASWPPWGALYALLLSTEWP